MELECEGWIIKCSQQKVIGRHGDSTRWGGGGTGGQRLLCTSRREGHEAYVTWHQVIE